MQRWRRRAGYVIHQTPPGARSPGESVVGQSEFADSGGAMPLVLASCLILGGAGGGGVFPGGLFAFFLAARSGGCGGGSEGGRKLRNVEGGRRGAGAAADPPTGEVGMAAWLTVYCARSVQHVTPADVRAGIDDVDWHTVAEG